MLRHMCRGMNRFKVFTLCLSPETSPLVSRGWEHPLGKLCSHTWFRVCFPVSAWAQRWDSPCPSVRCGREMPGSAHAGLQTCCSWLGLGNSPAGPCYKPLLQALPLLCWLCPNSEARADLKPHPSVHSFPEPSFKSGSHLCLHYGIDLWSL